MKYKIVKETKPSLSTFGKYKAVAVHERTLDTKKIIEEVKERNGFLSEGTVEAVLIGLSEVINRHLRNGDKVRLDDWGLMKLEIESDKVDAPEDFKPKKHIRGVRLHFLPVSEKGKPELYQKIEFQREKQFTV
jgi:predicted histone-like DNA-binding protein